MCFHGFSEKRPSGNHGRVGSWKRIFKLMVFTSCFRFEAHLAFECLRIFAITWHNLNKGRFHRFYCLIPGDPEELNRVVICFFMFFLPLSFSLPGRLRFFSARNLPLLSVKILDPHKFEDCNQLGGGALKRWYCMLVVCECSHYSSANYWFLVRSHLIAERSQRLHMHLASPLREQLFASDTE